MGWKPHTPGSLPHVGRRFGSAAHGADVEGSDAVGDFADSQAPAEHAIDPLPFGASSPVSMRFAADPGAPFAAASLSNATATGLLPVASAYLASGQPVSPGAALTDSAIGAQGATAAQVQQALDETGLTVNGAGIKVGVLSDSFNDLGGAATDEANGALPPASRIQVLEDLASGGTDEGRAMMQIVHDIAPGASLAFYTAFGSEQDFANGILALAAAGCKVICDDVSYFDEPFFQNGQVAQAIQTVEAEGVTYVTAAGNEASNAYQAAWTPISGTYDGVTLSDAESFGGSLVQTITVGNVTRTNTVPFLLEWNQPYGDATSDLEMLVFHNGHLYATATNITSGEPTNPWVDFEFTASGTYQIAIENLSGPDPGVLSDYGYLRRTEEEFEGGYTATIYLNWWTFRPKEMVKKFKAKLRTILLEADGMPTKTKKGTRTKRGSQ